ncbi:hypothetical protein J5N97_002477 [Dioscorea zingiberensis]|uniref:Laccase n=1 Tax=Dioscorea zingiberensis TaxID=325984 RepID=A0A9D5HPN3_9LILI|nr:hypothetical protein J5N97_002477 [Dioscorea zingiberensis]
MARALILLVCAQFLFTSWWTANAAVVEHTFHVGNLSVRRLCNSRVITAVNGQLPGPTIEANEGDQIVVHVINESPFNLSIHWHGMFQKLTPWADGPVYVTQCPILPGHHYTYRFNTTGQEGTLWWHAHVSWLRATVYGALIIRPKADVHSYPFPTPHKEIPILLGEWYNSNEVNIENTALATGAAPNLSNAYTINGRPGDLYPCSHKHIYKVKVVQGKTYMLRIINAALNNQLFFKIAKHNLTVVAVDACYTTPYNTDVVVLAPGQTVDALLQTNAPPGDYYMAALPYASASGLPFDNSTATGILRYRSTWMGSYPTPLMPLMPAFNDTPTAHGFYSNLTSLLLPGSIRVPLHVDEKMHVVYGLNLIPCGSNRTCQGPFGSEFAASMNNVSFQLPSTISLLEAHYRGVKGIYTSDFPDKPPAFDYTNSSLSFSQSMLSTTKGTRLKKLKYNAVVEVVLQNTALVALENHPLHLHGFNFFVLAQGFGNYNAAVAKKKFNLVNPQMRNTIAVPVGGWAVIRFIADNPGVWIMHCHLDAHLPWGLATAFEVENGHTASSTIPPPPSDFPKC